jgi:hypothetical protein
MNTVYLVVVLGLTMVVQCFAGEINVDILAGTINGKSVDSISIDELTDMLGRPSDSCEAFGQKVINYADKGLRFAFNNNDGRKFMTVHLVAYADLMGSFRAGSWQPVKYEAYKGKLSKGLSRDWKLKKFLEEFSEFKLVKETVSPPNQDFRLDCSGTISKGQRPFCKSNWIAALSS